MIVIDIIFVFLCLGRGPLCFHDVGFGPRVLVGKWDSTPRPGTPSQSKARAFSCEEALFGCVVFWGPLKMMGFGSPLRHQKRGTLNKDTPFFSFHSDWWFGARRFGGAPGGSIPPSKGKVTVGEVSRNRLGRRCHCCGADSYFQSAIPTSRAARWLWVKTQIVPPVNIPIPTKFKTGWCYPKMVPLVLTCQPRPGHDLRELLRGGELRGRLRFDLRARAEVDGRARQGGLLGSPAPRKATKAQPRRQNTSCFASRFFVFSWPCVCRLSLVGSCFKRHCLRGIGAFLGFHVTWQKSRRFASVIENGG